MNPASVTTQSFDQRDTAATESLRWQSWPLVDHPRWSWLAPVGVLAVGIVVGRIAESWLFGAVAVAALAAALRHFWLPVTFEILPQGIARRTWRRTRLLPWHTIRAYQPRATGIVFFQRPDPAPIDALRSVFLPYGDDEDETLCAVREHLPHAVELPS